MAEVIYRCTCCKKEYSTMEAANACEAKHAKCLRLVKQEYDKDDMVVPKRISLEYQSNLLPAATTVVSYVKDNGCTDSISKKWYVGTQRAEGTTKWVVELTDTEVAAIKKFLDVDITSVVKDESYSGSCSISEGFETRDDAVAKASIF